MVTNIPQLRATADAVAVVMGDELPVDMKLTEEKSCSSLPV